MNKFTLEQMEHGVIVRGSIPLDAFLALCKGYDGAVFHPGIANHYGATACIVNPENIPAWEKEIEDAISGLPREQRFLRGLHTGISSLTIFNALHVSEDDNPRFRPDTPRDACDFGRCHRLLKLFPEWRSELHKVGEKFPSTRWTKLALVWDELEALYEAGKKVELNNRLKDINGAL